jgi:hypothetical protein
VEVCVANNKARDLRDKEELKEQLLDLIRQKYQIKNALAVVGRSYSWYENMRKEDREWAGLVDAVRGATKDLSLRSVEVPDYPQFSAQYLNLAVHPHTQNIVDVLQGRDPSWLHPGMTYERGAADHRRVIVNVPPNHGKTMSISIGYVVWQLMRDPDKCIIIVSKSADLARKIVGAVKNRLTHPQYAEMQVAFGPVEGFKATAEAWSANRIFLQRDSSAKDPSLEALGMASQIYGSRSDLIILDDVVTLSNAGDHEKQREWILQEVSTRLGPGGQLLVVGTRVAPTDLYSELMNPAHYADGVVPWTQLSMPAVLEYAEKTDDWVTLWPLADEPFAETDEPDEFGQYPRWTGKRLAAIRNEVGTRKWSLVYMNSPVAEDATFDPVCVNGSVDGFRKTGPLSPGLKGHPENLERHYVVCGMDPAVAGNTAAVAYSVDRQTGERYVLDVRVLSAPTPMQIRELIYEMTDVYNPKEWVIETNAFQGFLVYDEEIGKYMANRGIVVKPHHTGSNKQDPEFGVASMSGLFGTTAMDGTVKKHQGDNLINLPSTQGYGVKVLVEELVSWNPDIPTRKRRQDTVMALWFCELRAREVIQRSSGRATYQKNPFRSDADKSRQITVDLDALFTEQSSNRIYV